MPGINCTCQTPERIGEWEEEFCQGISMVSFGKEREVRASFTTKFTRISLDRES
jgi:hypothetical protein